MVKVFLVASFAFGCSLSGTKNHCETQADCLDGFTCSALGECEQGSGSDCTPITCGTHCGDLDDHCGGTLACGACPDHCTNHAQDPSETDIDCGGDCAPCATGGHCAEMTDCASGTCDAGTCRAGTWSTVAPMPTARSELAAVVGTDGKIYAIGGNATGGASGVVEVFDPSANSWTTRAAMPTPRYGLAAVVGSDGRIYAIGGDYADISNAGASVVAQAFNPTANTWQTLPAFPVGRYDLAAAVDGNGVIYAIGGFDGTTDTVLGSVATWQLGAPSWSLSPDTLTTARDMHASAVMPDGRIYVLGGEHVLIGDEIDAFEYYQPGTSGWNTLAPMPTTRKLLATAALGTQLYALGGSRYVGSNQQFTRVVEVYDTVGHAWSQVTSLPSGRFGHAAVAVGGKIYVLGGVREDTDHFTATVDVFTPDP